MAAGSDVLALLSLGAIALFALMALRFYLPLRTTPQYLLVPVFLALVIPCSIIILVPIDLASSSRSDAAEGSRGIVLPDRVLIVSWRICYWLCFCLTWYVFFYSYLIEKMENSPYNLKFKMDVICANVVFEMFLL